MGFLQFNIVDAPDLEKVVLTRYLHQVRTAPLGGLSVDENCQMTQVDTLSEKLHSFCWGLSGESQLYCVEATTVVWSDAGQKFSEDFGAVEVEGVVTEVDVTGFLIDGSGNSEKLQQRWLVDGWIDIIVLAI